jgi:hypothetical protein
MGTLPSPVVHVDTVHIHLPDPATQSLAGSLSEAVDILKTDEYITGIAEEIVADQQAAKYFRDELEAALILAGVHVEPGITDQDLTAKVAVAVTAARTHLDALERVSAVTSRAHEFESPNELGLSVQAAIHPQLANPPQNAIPTPPAGTALFARQSGGDR